MTDVLSRSRRIAGRTLAGAVAGAAVLAVMSFAIVRGTSARAEAPPPHVVSPSGQLPAVSARPAVLPAATGPSFAPVVEAVSPAVVTIRTERRSVPSQTGAPDEMLREFFGPGFRGWPQEPRAFRQRGLGSGVLVGPDGYILTNHHVVDGAQQIRVELTDRRAFDATVVGVDPPSDLAVLQIKAEALPSAALGDSERVRVGDVVLAVGNPLGVGQTVTMGIVSAKGRATGLGDGSFEDFLQTDAPINQGNSGGALVNLSGEVIGINTQILSPSGGNIGLGFAVPANMARRVMDQLIKDGKVQRARLGVTVQPVTADIAASLGLRQVQGALVSDVDGESPAARAGLRVGDVITTFEGQPVNDGNALRNAVASSRPGSRVTLDVLRDGRTQSVQATLAELQARSAGAAAPRGESSSEGRFGMVLEPLTPALADRLDLPRTTEGLGVSDVDPDGPAASSGLQRGDVIVKANGESVRSVSGLRSALETVTDRPVLLLVKRGGANFFVTLRSPKTD
jgi:serine protease Do